MNPTMNTSARWRPTVTVSYAQTLDGRLATAGGSSQWISGPESLCFAHQLRASHDAILVGVGTILQDNPRLTVRHVAGCSPLRVIVDSTLRTPLTAAVLAEGAAVGTLLAVTQRASLERRGAARARGAAVACVPADVSGQVDLVELLALLHERGVRSIMVEGGAKVITSLLRLHLVDRLVICIAPKILGMGIDAIGDLGIQNLDRAMVLTDSRLTMYGSDVVIDGRVQYCEDDHGTSV